MHEDLPEETRQTDVMDPARAAALQISLGLPATIETGSPLPPFFHQIYFWDPEPTTRLGRDGHPATGIGLIPDLGLPRRMWAGGGLEFHEPLRAGITAQKRVSVAEISRKEGRTGPLAFVTLKHELFQNDHLCVTEYQDLVYRQDPSPEATKPAAPVAATDEDHCEQADFTSTLLFRYSALTFNGHRIHYDTEYARDIEGYAGLVTHGPLLAQLLMLLAERRMGALKHFTFRATAPLILGETATLCWKENGDMWIRAPDGRQCMKAKAG
ncbi:hypothetical protein TG4357_00566 [Thalassovita gelatinovora]|uniref:FAS1-like dehydratase domain-containing protein n=1 Tax=Thalassovita gelatinovora TaxID=53501 RepID=A0A0P1FRW9_THAGE|nr:MaoC family dehydratase N-terminal domain-containing protein [Thalassovita gelatinovora]QIZ80836.1 acyl dehydratase [Thalassovita gelatinovora]CUH63260.1 hypothetical protein TG4357_00566 [Thalassovita gelatinovora]SEQ64231.1 3-methylfumaryl-CoA hydratase [Thalassovita gelatinovora]